MNILQVFHLAPGVDLHHMLLQKFLKESTMMAQGLMYGYVILLLQCIKITKNSYHLNISSVIIEPRCCFVCVGLWCITI